MLWAVGCGQDPDPRSQPNTREVHGEVRGHDTTTPATGQQYRESFHTDIDDGWQGFSQSEGTVNDGTSTGSGKWQYDSGRRITFRHGLPYEQGQRDYFEEQETKRR